MKQPSPSVNAFRDDRMKLTAIVIGATGLVGSHLLKQLLEDENYEKVVVLHRRSTGVKHPKLEEHIIDFDQPDNWKDLVKGDHLFSALGTTIKKAGSQERQYTIDFTYQFETARIAAENGFSKYVLVSSAGANRSAKSFYPRLKGELDEAVKELSFETTVILRPSILKGDRSESRPMEKAGIIIAGLITRIPGLKKYRPIPAGQVAGAMRAAAMKCTPGYHIIELDELFYL